LGVSDLKLQVGPLRRVGAPHGAHDLADRHRSTLRHADLFEVHVNRIEATPMAQNHDETISFEWSCKIHRARFHGPYRRPGSRADPDSLPQQHGAVRSHLSPESIDQLAGHRPIQRSCVHTCERAWRCPPGGNPLDFKAPRLEVREEDGDTGLVEVELLHSVSGRLFLGIVGIERPAMPLFDRA